jgi:hypothetical protein
MTDEQIIEFARGYMSGQLDGSPYTTLGFNQMYQICRRLIELHDADQARRERLRSIGRKGGQANKGVPRVTPRRQFKRS